MGAVPASRRGHRSPRVMDGKRRQKSTRQRRIDRQGIRDQGADWPRVVGTDMGENEKQFGAEHRQIDKGHTAKAERAILTN